MAYKIGVIQLDSKGNRELNLPKAYSMIREAAANGARLVTLPEVFEAVSRKEEERLPEEIPGPIVKSLMELAKEEEIWIHGGSIREKGAEKSYNTTVLINPAGEICAKYRKLHLFDVDIKNGPAVRESDRILKGEEIVMADTGLGKLGLTICYDVRFPELYRLLALKGAEVIFVPANFTHPTGMAHWEVLLRARAIENGVWIVAANQTGVKEDFTASHGRSMVIDPWGRITAQAEFAETIIYADIDTKMVRAVQAQIPSLKNRRSDIYNLAYKGCSL